MKRSENPEVNRVVGILSQYQKDENRLNRLYERLATLETRIETVSSPVLSDLPRNGGTHMTTEDLIAEKIETEQEIKQLRENKVKAEARIYSMTDRLIDTREADVLERYYIDGCTLPEIGDDLHYSVRQIERFFYNGLNILASCA